MKNMSPEQLVARAEAVRELDEWPQLREAHNEDRARRIRVASALGVSQLEIAERMKVGRNTVRSVLGSEGEED